MVAPPADSWLPAAMSLGSRIKICLAFLIAAAALPVSAGTVARFQDDGLALYSEAGDARVLRRSDLTPLLRGKPDWSVTADIAALGKAEGKSWHLVDADCLPPMFERCLLFLAETGRPGIALREYDTRAGGFVPNGFALPPGPTQAIWYDDSRILVAANTGPGSLTSAGVPRLLKLWTRGQPVYAATTILAAPLDARGIRPFFSLSGGGLFHAAEVTTASGDYELYHFGWAQNFRRSQLPADARLLDFFQGRAVAVLGNGGWMTPDGRYPPGSLVAYPMAPLLGPASQTLPELAYTPPAGFRVVAAKAGRDTLYVHLRGASGDRLVSLRKGAPSWPAANIALPSGGPLELVAASDLADVALVVSGTQFHIVGRGRTRTIAP